jgi:hypothetical protein
VVLQHACDFIGVPYSSVMLDYASHSTYDPPDASLASQWTRRVTPREVQLVEARCGSLMQSLGYELSGLPPIAPSTFARAVLCIRSRLYSFRYRVRRFGWPLYLAAVAVRRTGPRAWLDRIQLRLNEIENQHLK